MPKEAPKYYCQICDFSCSKKSNYDKHLTTRKHILRQNTDDKKMPNQSFDIEKKMKMNLFVIVEKRINIMVHYGIIKKDVHLYKNRVKKKMKKKTRKMKRIKL